MRYIFVLILFLIGLIFSNYALGYSTYGAPAEFGNLTDTTCFVGGDDGIVNCTGDAYFVDGTFSGTLTGSISGTANSSSYWDDLDTPADLYYKILSYWQNITGRPTHLSNFTDNLGHIEDNASWNESLATTLYADISVVDTTIGNCSSQYSCNSVVYAGNTSWVTDNAYNTEAELTALLDNNYLELDGTGGSITGNIDSTADLEMEGGGICIDPAGCAVSAGNFEIENGSFCIDKDGSLDCTAGAGNISVMDGVIKVMSAGSWTPTYIGSDGDMGCEYDIEAGDDVYADDFWDSGTNINTLYVQANTWTSIDSYPATCAAATPFVGTIGDTSTCRGVDSDTSPQLGGYLDANGQNIGSTADEIENIYVGVNTKIYLGDGQEGEIYYDGSKLIIKV